MFAAPLGAQPHPIVPPLASVGKDLLAIQVDLTCQLRHPRFWKLGVSIGGHVHAVNIELHG